MEFKQKEALRYLRAKPGDKAAEILVDTVYLKLRNEVQVPLQLAHGKMASAGGSVHRKLSALLDDASLPAFAILSISSGFGDRDGGVSFGANSIGS